MKFAVSTASLFGRDYTEDALLRIADMGYRRAEVFLEGNMEYDLGFIETLKAIQDEKGMEITSVHPLTTQYEPQLFSSHIRAYTPAERDYRLVLEGAKRLSAPYYVMHGPMKLKRGAKANFAALGPQLQRLGDIAKEYGVMLTIENVHWCMVSDLACLKGIDPYVDGKTVGYTFDYKQAVQAGEDPVEYLKIMGDKLKHVHICGAVLDGDEVRTCMPHGDKAQMQRLFKQLKAMDYTGTVVLEVYSRNYRDYDELKLGCDAIAAMVEGSGNIF
ncbi:MAG: sugar phosphate isomerase/epimerase [Clostridiales bacterium]|nr:sugar phosphate isomerase/epimerase [Clostridiales bacterium]